MRLLEIFIQTPLAAAVGWTVLHSLWQGAIVSAVLGMVLLAARSPRFRYVAAAIAMLTIIGAFSATLVHLMPVGHNSFWRVESPALRTATSQIATDSSKTWERGMTAIVPWLAPLWIVGVLLFYLRYAAGLLFVQRLRSRGVCSVPEQWQTQLVRLSARFDLSRPILLLESCLAETPMVVGHFRPLILIPLGVLTGFPAAQIEALLLHELAHIRRHDYLVNSIQRLVEGILFYHPAIWWISQLIRSERENCCDDMAVSIGGNVREYAVALTALEETRWSGREPAVAANGGNLVKRIHRLLYPKAANSGWTPFLAALFLIGTAALSLGAWQSDVHSVAVSKSQPDASKSALHTKWLNEDVVYIINEQERAAFVRLTTDEERDKFIEEFWLRRDPTPATPENEFKEEHYRRIAYANKHWQLASGELGWRTDRGRIYILNGPPDEIESHPGGRQAQRDAWEDWGYRRGAGSNGIEIFTFIDRARTGDYRLVIANAK